MTIDKFGMKSYTQAEYKIMHGTQRIINTLCKQQSPALQSYLIQQIGALNVQQAFNLHFGSVTYAYHNTHGTQTPVGGRPCFHIDSGCLDRHSAAFSVEDASAMIVRFMQSAMRD